MVVMEEWKEGKNLVRAKKKLTITWTWLLKPRQFVCFLFFVTLFFAMLSSFVFRKHPVKIVLKITKKMLDGKK